MYDAIGFHPVQTGYSKDGELYFKVDVCLEVQKLKDDITHLHYEKFNDIYINKLIDKRFGVGEKK